MRAAQLLPSLHSRKRANYAWLNMLVAALVIMSIWLPEYLHYYVSVSIPEEAVQRSRVNPPQPILDEASELRMGLAHDNANAVEVSKQLLAGTFAIPGAPPVAITLPFSAHDLDRGTLSWQLALASLAAPDCLIQAYVKTGKSEYFELARDMILAWARFEKQAWRARSFLWNDHAVAARVVSLTRFWNVYRLRDDFDAAAARSILEMAARATEMLAKPGHFTAATNHGIMQNLALLHAGAAFPELPRRDEHVALALERLRDQLRFYVNSEGVVLEHSAGYHAFGVYLLGKILRYLTLNEIAPPPEWVQKYERAQEVYALLRLPDGSLPLYGDTRSGVEAVGQPDIGAIEDLSPSHALYPVAGHAIWRDRFSPGAESQTFFTWSHFPGHGHKLADELSMLIWAEGQPWVTHPGYWPYGAWGREQAESWLGSNAPHLAGEPAGSARHASLQKFAWSEEGAFIDIVRKGPDGYSARRQAAYISPGVWVVLDHIQDSSSRATQTLWTLAPGVKVRAAAGANDFLFESNKSRARMWLQGSAGTSVRRYSGSRDPFAGWAVVDNRPIPAPAFLVEQPSRDSWALSVWMSNPEPQLAAPALQWQNANAWKVAISGAEGKLEVERSGDSIVFTRGENASTLKLAKAPDVSAAQRAISHAFQAAAEKYERYPQSFQLYRMKVTYLLVALLLAQEIFFAVFSRFRGIVALRLASTVAWLAGGVWLSLFYFAR